MKKARFVIACVLATCLLLLLLLLSHNLSISDSNASTPTSVASPTQHFEGTVIERCKWYHLVETDGAYYCYFHNQNGLLVQSEGPFAKLPKISLVNERIVYFSVQAGTGTGTQWGYFYDGENGTFSDVYSCILDYTDHLVSYADGNMVIVCNIFNPTYELIRIVDFQYSFSDVAFPFVDAVLSEADSTIEITYLHGNNYQKITEIFEFSK